MTATYTCIACDEPIIPGRAVIVGIDLAGYPDELPANIVAHRSCEDRARAVIAQRTAAQLRSFDTSPE